MKHTIATAILAVVAYCLLPIGANAQTPQTGTQVQKASKPADGSQTQELEELRKAQAELDARTRATEEQSKELRAELESTTKALELTGILLASVLAIGTIASLFGFIRSEKRAAEAHRFSLQAAIEAEQRASQGFKLAITGETAAQQRATEVHEKFLSGSKETLELVNATLNLAKEASERAARTVERRAKQTIDQLDRDARSLLHSVPSQDDRALIANPGTRSSLRSLAHKISGFEINSFMLPEGLHVTPYCVFIRGMDFHLNQQSDDAIQSWSTVTLSNEAPDLSKAWRGIGSDMSRTISINSTRLKRALKMQLASRMRPRAIGGSSLARRPSGKDCRDPRKRTSRSRP